MSERIKEVNDGNPFHCSKDQTGLTSDEKIVLLFQPDTLSLRPVFRECA